MEISIQSVSISRGISWVTEALPYFTRNPLGWIAAIVVIFMLSIIISFIPFVGTLALNLLYPVVIGGYMLGCKAHYSGDSFEFQHVFAGFKEPYFVRLIILGAIYTAATIVMLILFMILVFITLGGMEVFHQLEQGQLSDITQYQQSFILLTLVGAVFFLPFIMAMWFAPVIIISSDETPISAMVMSFKACLANILPFTLYGIVVFILAILAALPLMLGYLVLLPVMSASVFVAYLDCFKEDTTNEPAQLIQ